MANAPGQQPWGTRRDTQPYGLHVPYTRGYAVNTPNRQAGVGIHADDWNARVIDQNGSTIELWVDEWETSFEMGGQTAQSRFYRQFFPHNFVEPTLTLGGRVANSWQYNRLSSFVRNSQYHSLFVNTASTVNLQLRAGGPKIRQGARGNIKGRHTAWNLNGYVKRMPAGAKHFDTAPRFQFEFIIASSHSGSGIYTDTRTAGSQILPWLDIFKRTVLWTGEGKVGGSGSKAPGFVPDPINHSTNPGSSKPVPDLAEQLGAFLGSIF